MPSERVIEVPWALSQLPQSGVILDVGSCETTYLAAISQCDRVLHCLDVRECEPGFLPDNATFHHEDIIGNTLPREYFDAVLLLSTLEHIGLPHYNNRPFPYGDRLALHEASLVLKPDGVAIVTVPAGYSKICSWYRQYSPLDLHRLFANWRTEITYWGFTGTKYEVIDEGEVERFDYRVFQGAGAIAGIKALKNSTKAAS